jgi:hypothetical protein
METRGNNYRHEEHGSNNDHCRSRLERVWAEALAEHLGTGATRIGPQNCRTAAWFNTLWCALKV